MEPTLELTQNRIKVIITCPITGKIFFEPVIWNDVTYEKSALVAKFNADNDKYYRRPIVETEWEDVYREPVEGYYVEPKYYFKVDKTMANLVSLYHELFSDNRYCNHVEVINEAILNDKFEGLLEYVSYSASGLFEPVQVNDMVIPFEYFIRNCKSFDVIKYVFDNLQTLDDNISYKILSCIMCWSSSKVLLYVVNDLKWKSDNILNCVLQSEKFENSDTFAAALYLTSDRGEAFIQSHFEELCQKNISTQILMYIIQRTRKIPINVITRYCELEVIVEAVSYGADFRIPDCDGDTAFHSACQFRDEDIITFFMKNKYNKENLNKVNKWNCKPLHSLILGFANKNRNISWDLFSKIIDETTDLMSYTATAKTVWDPLKTWYNGMNILHLACKYLPEELLLPMIEKFKILSFDFGATSIPCGNSPLMIACQYQSVKVIKKLASIYREQQIMIPSEQKKEYLSLNVKLTQKEVLVLHDLIY